MKVPKRKLLRYLSCHEVHQVKCRNERITKRLDAWKWGLSNKIKVHNQEED
jgi:hypothetical protein